MKKVIDINNWNRKEHFEWFSKFDEPFFGIVSEIDCTKVYANSKKENIPFFHSYLHSSLKAANLIDNFRLRIEETKVVSYNKINASATLNNRENLYAMSFIQYHEDKYKFSKAITNEENRIKKIKGLGVSEDTMRKDVIHYSSVPWFKITGLSHPRNYKFVDSVPKITFGKFEDFGSKKIMNIAINAHHGLMDGFHIGEYLKLFQDLLNS